jgi:hypothetical protein
LIRTPAAAGTLITKLLAVSTAFSVTLPPDGAESLIEPAICYPHAVPLNTSTALVVELNLI